MSYRVKLMLCGAGAVLVFDVLASLASARLGFPYALASIGSVILYLAIGYLAARGALNSPLRDAAVAAAIAGLVDASAGWAISSQLEPSGLPSGAPLTAARWISTAIVVVALAAAVGALGGIAGRSRPKISAPVA